MINELTKKSDRELLDLLKQGKKDLLNFRFQLSRRQLKDTSLVSKKRQEVARVSTELSRRRNDVSS